MAVSLKSIKVIMAIAMMVIVAPSLSLYSQTKQKCKRPSKQCLEFIMTASGHGVSADGMPMSIGRWETPDGAIVFRDSFKYPSPSAAVEKLELSLERAKKIGERTPAMEKKQRVGERAVAIFPNDAGGERVMIFRTSGETFIQIEASSHRLALAFEAFSFQ